MSTILIDDNGNDKMSKPIYTIFHLWRVISPFKKCPDFGGFRILEFRIKDSQPVVTTEKLPKIGSSLPTQAYIHAQSTSRA